MLLIFLCSGLKIKYFVNGLKCNILLKTCVIKNKIDLLNTNITGITTYGGPLNELIYM